MFVYNGRMQNEILRSNIIKYPMKLKLSLTL